MANKAPAKPVKGSFKQGQLTLWLSVGFVGLVLWQLSTVMVLFFGMLPTIVSAIIDRTPKKHATFCIGGINLCGVFPYLMELWAGDNSLAAAMLMLTDVFALAIMYGAAAFGWMIIQTLPPIIATFVTIVAQSRISSLRSSQRLLIEEWGEDVGTPQEVIDMREELGEEEKEPELPPSPVSTGNTDTDALLDGIDNLLGGGGAQSASLQKSPAGGSTANGTPPPTSPKTA